MAVDTSTNKVVAIKKISAPFKSEEMARRCLREIHLLRIISHPNVLSFCPLFLAEPL
jgi:serine/threonine protein kinase